MAALLSLGSLGPPGSGAYATLAGDLGVKLSVGRKGECWDCDDLPVLLRSA